MAKTLVHPKVAIIGAGCAGLAAATELSQSGIDVTIFEAADHTGGRARKLHYKSLDLDNGQHILLGAYSQTLRLLSLANVDVNDFIERIALNMHMQHLQHGNVLRLKTLQYLPAHINLLVGLLTAHGLSTHEKYLAIRMMTWLHIHRFKVPTDIDLGSFLKQRGQTDDLTEKLWEPLCLAALNTPLHIASAQVFANVLRDSFARKKHDSDMLLPKVDLSKLIADPLLALIQSGGGNLRKLSAVKNINSVENQYLVQTDSSEEIFDAVVLASGPHQLKNININAQPAKQVLSVPEFDYEPITTIYIQYDKDARLTEPMQGLLGSISQWVFDRGQIYGQYGLLAVVISASGKHQKLSQDELANAVITELKTFFPTLPVPIWHKVITEKRATFSCVANVRRPENKTSLPNLFLAGDYTAGDYPATIEGAIRSGVKCAQYIMKDFKDAQ